MPSRRLDRTRRFFRTPKGLLTILFGIVTLVAAPVEGVGVVAPSLAAAVVAAMALDLPILRLRKGVWEFPSGALLTGVIVAMVLSPHEAWWVSGVTAAVAVGSKYVFRTRSANVFNPAALALVGTFYVFSTGQNWWGAMPDAGVLGLIVLLATGIFITDRVNKVPLVLAFLGSYFLLFTIVAFTGDAALVSEIFRAPDLQAALYFAFFILTDPPTSPVKYPDQILCGALVAVVAFAVFEGVGAAYYLLAGVLVGNVWEAWRRTRVRARSRAAVALS
jgi:Na+-translocating ferredoxin:NAD+ oxidoreductase RnfD subunit